MARTVIEEAAAGDAEIIGLTVEQYDYMIEHGLLDEDTSSELLDGLIVRKDRAKAGEDPVTVGDRHSVVVNRLTRVASRFEPHGSYLQIQQPVRLPPRSEPEPDASVVRGDPDAATGKAVAADVLCVIEVADHSLARDLGTKLRAYAHAGIPQYVVIDLVHDVILDHANPAGGSYPVPTTLRRGGILLISAGSGQFLEVAVDRLLP